MALLSTGMIMIVSGICCKVACLAAAQICCNACRHHVLLRINHAYHTTISAHIADCLEMILRIVRSGMLHHNRRALGA